MTEHRLFPFSAVVGQDDVKLALLLNAIDGRIGGVLLRGQKGSAKSTLARGLAAVLAPGAPFVELPVSATEDRVVGTLDIESALTTGLRRFQPGLLAAADGGVLYIDEVNLLPDHLVDVLLDVAASGVNRVEREGISETHPSRFVLIGSMNPEEGDLRPQLLDRFGLAVDVASSTDPDERAEAVSRRLAFDRDHEEFAEEWNDLDVETAGRLAAADASTVELPNLLVRTVGELCASVGAEGLRADLVICRAAVALAAWEGRGAATVEDVRRVAPLALGHRRRRTPLDEPGISESEIDDALQAPPPDDGAAGNSPSPEDDGRRGDNQAGDNGSPGDGRPDDGGSLRRGDPDTAATPPAAVITLTAPRAAGDDRTSGRRSLNEGNRGRLIGSRRPAGPITDVAIGPTVRSAADRHSSLPAGFAGNGPKVEPGDLRQAVREHKTGNLIVLAVDASASMGVERRMEAIKGAIASLLLDAYQRRDRVALVTFRGESAEVVLRPTASIEVARARLAELRTGGRTPLAAGIDTALAVASAASGPHLPLLVVVSDGRATAGPADVDPVTAARTAAAEVARRAVPGVVIDTEDGPTRLGLAAELAAAMGARHLLLPELSAGALVSGIRQATAPLA